MIFADLDSNIDYFITASGVQNILVSYNLDFDSKRIVNDVHEKIQKFATKGSPKKKE